MSMTDWSMRSENIWFVYHTQKSRSSHDFPPIVQAVNIFQATYKSIRYHFPLHSKFNKHFCAAESFYLPFDFKFIEYAWSIRMKLHFKRNTLNSMGWTIEIDISIFSISHKICISLFSKGLSKMETNWFFFAKSQLVPLW